jgi:hypothetical protein
MSPDPFYVDPGYVDDGYIFAPAPIIITCGDTRCDLRSATRRSGTVRLYQPLDASAGAVRFGYAPFAVEYGVTHEYDRLNLAERAALEAVWNAAAGSAREVSCRDARIGLTIPARLEAALATTEVSYDLCRGTVALTADVSFLPPPATLPTIDDANLVLTGAAYPGGRSLTRNQPRRRTSGGALYVYTMSPGALAKHSVALTRRTLDQLAALLHFFVTAAQGPRTIFPWTDPDAIARQVRFSSSTLAWAQSTVRSDLYDVTVELEEQV